MNIIKPPTYRTLVRIDGIVDLDGMLYLQANFPAIWPHRTSMIPADMVPEELVQVLDSSPGFADSYHVYLHVRVNTLEAEHVRQLEFSDPFEYDIGYWDESGLFGEPAEHSNWPDQKWASAERGEITWPPPSS